MNNQLYQCVHLYGLDQEKYKDILAAYIYLLRIEEGKDGYLATGNQRVYPIPRVDKVLSTPDDEEITVITNTVRFVFVKCRVKANEQV